MSSKRRCIKPLTFEQKRKEEELSAGLRDAERQAVIHTLSQDRTPTGLLHVLNNAMGFAESMAQKLRNPRTPPVDCKEGCSWCCYQSVPVTAPDAFAIAEHIQSLDHAEIETRSTKLEEVNRRTRSLTPRDRTRQHVPCAFLEGEKCSIYQVRPLACSEFTSLDVGDCRRAYRVGFKPKGIVHEKARMVTFYAVERGLSDGLHESLPASDCTPLELTAAVIAALRPSAAEAWLAGEKIFDRAHLVFDASETSVLEPEGDEPRSWSQSTAHLSRRSAKA